MEAPGAAPCDEHRRASLSGRLADTGKPEVTADDLDARDGAPSDPSDVREYKPKPPLWRPDRERRRSTLTIVLTALSVALGAALLTIFLFEGHFLASPATATPVTITAIESTSHADEDPPMHIIYRVSLPDGTHARLSSARVHRPGTRLVAMVSRGRFTGRIMVAPPYVVLPEN